MYWFVFSFFFKLFYFSWFLFSNWRYGKVFEFFFFLLPRDDSNFFWILKSAYNSCLSGFNNFTSGNGISRWNKNQRGTFGFSYIQSAWLFCVSRLALSAETLHPMDLPLYDDCSHFVCVYIYIYIWTFTRLQTLDKFLWNHTHTYTNHLF